MPQLNNSFMNEIRRTLNTAKFSTDDFEISFPDKGKVLAMIAFNYYNDYKIYLTQEEYTDPRSMENKTGNYVTMSPGAHKATERYEISSLGDFSKSTPKWCDYIYRDLIEINAKPDPLDEIKRRISEQIGKNIEEPETPFGADELKVVHEKLDDLYSQIEGLKDQLQLNKQQLSQIKIELDSYKATAENLPKGIWAQITSNKLIRFFGQILNTPEGRQLLLKTIPQSLGMRGDNP